MAKNGLKYYQADTDRFNDSRILRLVNTSEFGMTGYVVYEFLLNEIYRQYGYFLPYDEDSLISVAIYWRLNEDLVHNIAEYCLKIGLFDKEQAENNHILTSKSIQERYSTYCKRYNRNPDIEARFCLILPQNDKNTPRNTKNHPQNGDARAGRGYKNKKEIIKEKGEKEKSADATFSSAVADPELNLEEKTEIEVVEEKKEQVVKRNEFDEIKDYWNANTSTAFPAITKMTDKRKKLLRARINEYGLEAIYRAIDRAARSDFLKGQNSRQWQMTFDWFILPTNFPKVLEGNYDNKQITSQNNGTNISNPNNGTYADNAERKPYSRIQELGRTRFNLEGL